jgi:CHAT domain-containing protein/tetratricopeptide (TPR) repeat protein
MLRFFLLFLFFLPESSFAQQKNQESLWDEMLEDGRQNEALSQIIEFTQGLILEKKYDSLPNYLEVYGRILQANYSPDESEQKIQTLVENWESLSNLPSYQWKLLKSFASWYAYVGNTTAAYDQTLLALEWAQKELPTSGRVIGDLYLNLGGFAIQNMDLPAAKKHLRQLLSLKLSESDPENIYFANSYLGNIAYFSSNLDSAAFFYKKAVEAIDQLEPTPRNQFYRKSIISNNLAGVQMAQSDFEAAEQSMNVTISNQEKYMATDLDPTEYQKLAQSYFRSLDNLAGLYRQVGSYSRALQLLEFSFSRKAEEFGEEDLETAKSRVLLGQTYFDVQEFEAARRYLNAGLRQMQSLDEESTYWQGDALYSLARLEDYLQNEDLADSLYHSAKAIFDEELQGEYDVYFLEFLKNFSKFLAENQQVAEAIRLSGLARNYLAKIESDNLQLDYNQTINLASIYELGGEYPQALESTQEAFEKLELLIKRSQSPRDSLQAIFLKPQAILIRNRSRYAGAKPERDLLLSIEKELREGLQIIDSQSDFLYEPSDISIQLDLNQEYFEFLEKIELELFQISKNQVYLDRLLAYHEHARYRQIRSRLQKNQLVRFGGVPKEILEREEHLKEQLKQALQAGASDLSAYSKANEEWDSFLDSLKLNYPKYFQLHFETSENVLARVYSKLDPDITYLRYLTIDGDWLLLTILGTDKNLIPLDSKGVSVSLENLTNQTDQRRFEPDLLHELYNLLWKPAAEFIKTQRVAVIPEGLLFNLSFEILSKKQIADWSQLADQSLLQDHSFSYQYGLLFLDLRRDELYEDQLVAFAPGFFDTMKQTYSASFLDRQFLDLEYLKLIPQPFTRRLVEEISSKFDAKVFLESGSTVKNFKNEAGQSKIIHIGTHAISSNVNPSDSRLIFAKSAENPLDPHELFASEIYELDLRSELAVLLACESGKPAYSPGEGMISLAHAFNYSGTESLLMGLWKIDEKASVSITSDFYDFLEVGMSKDEALRAAKLSFLSKAKGRELDPSFWAGLILLGNPEMVVLESKTSFWPIFAVIILSIIFVGIYFREKIRVN